MNLWHQKIHIYCYKLKVYANKNTLSLVDFYSAICMQIYHSWEIVGTIESPWPLPILIKTQNMFPGKPAHAINRQSIKKVKVSNARSGLLYIIHKKNYKADDNTWFKKNFTAHMSNSASLISSLFIWKRRTHLKS